MNGCGSAVTQAMHFAYVGECGFMEEKKQAETNHTEQEDHQQNIITRSFTGIIASVEMTWRTQIPHARTQSWGSQSCASDVGRF